MFDKKRTVQVLERAKKIHVLAMCSGWQSPGNHFSVWAHISDLFSSNFQGLKLQKCLTHDRTLIHLNISILFSFLVLCSWAGALLWLITAQNLCSTAQISVPSHHESLFFLPTSKISLSVFFFWCKAAEFWGGNKSQMIYTAWRPRKCMYIYCSCVKWSIWDCFS